MLNKFTVRNIFKKDFQRLFSNTKIEGRSKRIFLVPGERDLYDPVIRIISEELAKGTHLSDEILDEFLFEQLFYASNNWQYIYRNEDFASIFRGGTEQEITDFINGVEGLNLNALLVDNIGEEEFSICTTRLESEGGQVKKINFLLKIDTVENENEKLYMFSGITIDLENDLVIIRVNQTLQDLYKMDPMDMLRTIKDMLNASNRYGVSFETLNLHVVGLNEEEPKTVISQLLRELSSEAEDILNSEVPENTDNDIREFLEGKGLPREEDYIQQIKSVIFQDIAKKCAETTFSNGWIFRFVFREGATTRASSRTEDRTPIYGSRVYWHLKELIFNSDDVQEAGFHWYLTDPTQTDDPDFVQVRLESKYDALIIHYYYKMREGRKEKEEYVLSKIIENL